MTKQYLLPKFLEGQIKEAEYVRWLRRKAQAHLKRDRSRGNQYSTGEEYRHAIHKAVLSSDGSDFYSGERLDWSLISTYDNDESAQGRREYKSRFALLPTVDHVNDGTGPADFVICSWRINSMKNDLTHSQLVQACIRILHHTSYSIQTPRDAIGAEDEKVLFAQSCWELATAP